MNVEAVEGLKLEGDTLPPKQEYFENLAGKMRAMGFDIATVDSKRPWGGFIQIPNDQAPQFIETFFFGVQLPAQTEGLDLSPKILVVAPHQKLSWQVHQRRAEFWRVVDGPVGAYRGAVDDLDKAEYGIYKDGETIDLPTTTRHRLAGLDNLGLVAELWIHTDQNNPSDEEDNRRIEDDYQSLPNREKVDW